MGILSYFSGIFGSRGRGLTNPDQGYQATGPIVSSNPAGVPFGDSRAMEIPAVWQGVNLLSGVIASLPLEVRQRDAEGNSTEATDYFLEDLLRFEPNPLMTAFDFRRALVVQRILYGNAYCQIIRNPKGVPLMLWPLAPDRVSMERLPDNSLVYRYSSDKGIAILAQESVLHVKGSSLDGIAGMSLLDYGRASLGLTVAAENMAGNFYRKGGRPSGVLMLDKLLTPEQRAAIRENFADLADGGEAGGLYVLESSMKYQAISVSPEDSQLLETRSFQIEEIARLLGIPPVLLMSSTNSTSWGSGIEQQILAFFTFSVEPTLKAFEAAFNRWLVPSKDRRQYYVEHNPEGLLRMDSAAKASFLSSMTQNGLMSRNEGRDKLNLNRSTDQGADELTAQVNLAPLAKLGSAIATVSDQAPPA